MAKINLTKGETSDTKINLRKDNNGSVVNPTVPVENNTSSNPNANTNTNKSLFMGIGIGLAVAVVGFFAFNGKNNTSETSRVSTPPIKTSSSSLANTRTMPVNDTPKSSPAPIVNNTSKPYPAPIDNIKTGYVNGNEVILRTGPSVSSTRLDELNKNTNVTILDKISGNNTDDAVLVRSAYLNYKGDRITLEPGLAVKVNRKIGSKYECTIEIDKKPIQINNVDSSDIRFIRGESWYRVRLNNGKEGYIFGKYVTER